MLLRSTSGGDAERGVIVIFSAGWEKKRKSCSVIKRIGGRIRKILSCGSGATGNVVLYSLASL
jgi:hypothetical protein